MSGVGSYSGIGIANLTPKSLCGYFSANSSTPAVGMTIDDWPRGEKQFLPLLM
jgi:hypothetical protein